MTPSRCELRPRPKSMFWKARTSSESSNARDTKAHVCVFVNLFVCVCASLSCVRKFFGCAPVARCFAPGMKIKTSRLQRKFLQQHVPEALWTRMWHEAGALQVEVHAGVIWLRGGQSFLGPLTWLPTQLDQPSLCAKPIFLNAISASTKAGSCHKAV